MVTKCKGDSGFMQADERTCYRS